MSQIECTGIGNAVCPDVMSALLSVINKIHHNVARARYLVRRVRPWGEGGRVRILRTAWVTRQQERHGGQDAPPVFSGRRGGCLKKQYNIKTKKSRDGEIQSHAWGLDMCVCHHQGIHCQRAYGYTRPR
ncbi:hypothetical protein LX36DRAFT_655003 [Colletotrichum falcatum]|nr:hypothetical protein LX36DRAFT_655003 [Colletotrichum falcatum]